MPTKQYRVNSNAMFHAPGMFPWIAAATADSFNEALPNRDALARLWFISSLIPALPCGVALALATGRARVSNDGDVAVIEVDDG